MQENVNMFPYRPFIFVELHEKKLTFPAVCLPFRV